LVGYTWSAGWNVAWVQSDERLTPSFEPGLPSRGRYDLSRIDAGANVTFHHPFLEPGIEVRRMPVGGTTGGNGCLEVGVARGDDGEHRPGALSKSCRKSGEHRASLAIMALLSPRAHRRFATT